MSLIDELRDVAKVFPPSHSPSHGEVLGVVGALVALIEHGPNLLSDVEREYLTVAKFLGGVVDEPTPADPVTADPAVANDQADTIAALQLQNTELQQQLANAVAVMHRTHVGDVTHDEQPASTVEPVANGSTSPPVPENVS